MQLCSSLSILYNFPCDSDGKASTYNVGDLGSILRLGRSPRREQLPTPVFWPGELHGLYSPWGCKELDTTEQLSLHFTSLLTLLWVAQFSSVTQLCPILCDPMNQSTPGLPIYHQLLESTQTHVHWVGDAIQPSHPLSSPSPPALNLSQHQGLFKWVSSSHQMAKVLEFQLQHQSFQWILRTDLL